MTDDTDTNEAAGDGGELIDDWNLDFDFHVFAQHQKQRIYSEHLRLRTDVLERTEAGRYMLVDCVEALTPVDMVNLGSGLHDATGHCVWMGAFLFVDAMQALSEYFCGKRVVELGCGTGIASIGLLCSHCATPSFAVLTDADPSALALCRRNCTYNEVCKSSYDARVLTWGDNIDLDDLHDSSAKGIDTVLATDVLYDIGLLQPLFQTAVDLLSARASSDQNNCGVFVLSHVPRACYSSEHRPVENLEEYITQRAEDFGFHLIKCIRPCDLEDTMRQADALNNVGIHEMDQIGAAILVFSL